MPKSIRLGPSDNSVQGSGVGYQINHRGNGGDKSGGNGGNGDARISNKQLSYIVALGKGLRCDCLTPDLEHLRSWFDVPKRYYVR